MKTSHLTLGKHRRYDAAEDPATELLAGVLRAFLFWNTGPLHTFRQEDGLFAYHSATSAAEWFCVQMAAIGVLVPAGHRGYRVTLRYDAIEAYSAYLIDAGLNVDDIVGAFGLLLVEGCLELLPDSDSQEPFDAKYFESNDGSTSFDTRKMLSCLVELGYAIRSDQKYVWTTRMRDVMRNDRPWKAGRN